MAEIDWEATARKAGWDAGSEAPHGDVLIHVQQERIWPAGDWKGALHDLGFEQEDEEWIADIVYLPSQNLGM